MIARSRCGVSFTTLCLLFGGVAAAGDWPQDGGDAARRGCTAESLPDELAVRWTLDLPRLTPAWPDQSRLTFDACHRPIIVADRLIVGSSADDSVAAHELATGRLIWRFFAGGPVRLPPASDGVRVFAGADDGWLYALSVDRGELLWKFKGAPQSRLVLGNGRLIDTWCVRGGPVVTDGQVYFAAGIWPFMGIFLHCLDAATGKPVWSNSAEGETYMIQPHGALSFGGIAPQGPLAVSENYLLVPGGRTLPGCYDRRTGKRLHFVLNSKTGGSAVAANERFYFCAATAYDWKDGRAVSAAPNSPVLDGDRVYGLAGDSVVATDLATMTKPDAKPAIGTKPLVKPVTVTATVPFADGTVVIKAGARLIVGGKDTLAAFALPLTIGAPPVWSLPVQGTVGTLLAANGHLIAVTNEGRVYCFGAKLAAASGSDVQNSKLASNVLGSGDVTRPPILNSVRLSPDLGAVAGYALVLGGNGAALAEGLVARNGLHVLILEPDGDKVQQLRVALRDNGLYGDRIAVYAGDIVSAPLPPYFASLVVADEATSLPSDTAWCARLFRVLHPYHGKAYLRLSSDQRRTLEQFASGDTPGKATVDEVPGWVRLTRSGGLPGAGNWTHEHADAANTRISSDTLVKAPLGLLWFGGSSHDGILPRHGHGPQPQVLDGRLVIEKVDGLRSVDIYTGRILWEATVAGLGSYYNNTKHQYGANGTGTNFISTPEALYARYRRECLRFDPATGRPLPSLPLPDGVAGGNDTIWGYLNVTGDYVIGGAASPDLSAGTLWDRLKALRKAVGASGEEAAEGDTNTDDEKATAVGTPEVPQAIESRSLFVVDRRTGGLLWSAAAKGRFRHNAICAGGGRLYAIDRPPGAISKEAAAKDKPAEKARLSAFDLATGKVLWSSEKSIFGTWLSYSAQHDVLIEGGSGERDVRFDESRGLRAWRARDGRSLWHDKKATGPAMIRGDWVLRGQGACEMLSGKPVKAANPLTGKLREWKWTRSYGCNTPAGSEHLLAFRSGAAGFYDLARLGGTGNWGGFRSSCTNNLLIAGGIITAADYTRTCTCSYQNQTSVALVPDPDADLWTYQGSAPERREPIRRLGVNFGAPGNRVGEEGTLWLEYPRLTDPPAKGAPGVARLLIQVTTGVVDNRPRAASPANFYRHHSSTVTGPLPWVCASGASGLQSIRIALGGGESEPRLFTVRLYFAEPDDLAAGARPFDVSLQGREVLENFDIVQEAGSPRRGIVKEFSAISVEDDLVVTLHPRGTLPAIISGIQIQFLDFVRK